MMKQNVIFPTQQFWNELAGKMGYNLDLVSDHVFLMYLSDFCLDANGLLLNAPNPSDENFYIVKSDSTFLGYIGNVKFFKMSNLFDLIFYAILLHQIFAIKFAGNFENLATFILLYSGNKEFLRIGKSKNFERLPQRVADKLQEISIIV